MLIRVMMLLLSISLFPQCGSQGWIVGNLPLTPQDTAQNTVFIEIVDVDSVIHWYHGQIYESQNWCYKHYQLEDVVIK